jgi:lactoylglutathione lyase
MKLGYTLLYVKDVPGTVAFYEQAFGIERAFVHETNTYAEMSTGGTKLGFVSHDVASHSVKYKPVTTSGDPPGIEIGFVTDDVDGDYDRAIKAGAARVLAPTTKPWGQKVSYVRDCNGFLIEICSPMG